jgi:hypothetical protein
MPTQEEIAGSSALVEKPFQTIKFQLGPVKEVGVNGTTMDAVITTLIERLEGFQKGPFACRDNAIALTKLEEACMWLRNRTAKRVAQGVEGYNTPHKD